MAEDNIAVSVIIAALNAAAIIARQLEALAAQQGAPTFEVIVSDNGSTDDTVGVVKRWAESGLGAISTLSIVDSKARRGISYARSIAALAAKGRVLAFCDADDRVLPGWVAAVDTLADGMAGGCTLLEEGGELKALEDLHQTPYLPFPGGGNCAITRETFFDIGGFDLSYPPYGAEDVELSWRAQEAGYTLHYLPDMKLEYTVTPPSKSYRKSFLRGVSQLGVAVRHPQFKAAYLSLRAVGVPAVKQTLNLPLQLLKKRSPEERAALIQTVCDSLGRLTGYGIYVVFRKRPEFISSDAKVRYLFQR